MQNTSPEALRIVAVLRERFLKEYSASLPHSPLVVTAKRFGFPAQAAHSEDTASAALFAALRGTPSGELTRIKQGAETDIARLYQRALQLYEKAASERLLMACLGWRMTVAKAIFDHPCGARDLARYLKNDDHLVITTTTDGELAVDFRAPSHSPLANPGIIYSRALCEHGAFQYADLDCHSGFVEQLEQAISAAEKERDSLASRSKSTPREVGETRVLSTIFKALTPDVALACYHNLLGLAAGSALTPDDIGNIRVYIESESPMTSEMLTLKTALLLPESGPGAVAQQPPSGHRHRLMLYQGRSPIDAECCYLEHAAHTVTAFPATLAIDSGQPMRIADARLDLSADTLSEGNPARAAQLWNVMRAEQAPITPAQFRAALRLAYPGKADADCYLAYAQTYPGKADAVRRWASDDRGDHVPRDSFNLLLIRAGLHREYAARSRPQPPRIRSPRAG